MSDAGNLETEIREFLAQDRKIDAIKLYRERTGAGLAEAKQAVEGIERGSPRPETPAADDGFDEFAAQLIALLEAGRKIEAIKLYRARTRVGLAEAKAAVEALAAQRGIVAAKAGCAGALLALAAGLWAAWRLA